MLYNPTLQEGRLKIPSDDTPGNNKHANKNNFHDVMFLAICSNSESIIITCISISETLWTQTQLKIK